MSNSGGENRPISVRGRLRVGDSGRELAVGVLKRVFEKGQLTQEELEERVGLAYAAKIRHDLRPLLEDLEEYQRIRINRCVWRYWLD
jgi:transcription initiation factor IIE alpha subunit